MNLKEYGLLNHSDALLRTPKPGRSLVDIKFNAVRKGENNKVTLGPEEGDRASISDNRNDSMPMELPPISSR